MKLLKFIILFFLILQGCAFAKITPEELQYWYRTRTEYISDEAQWGVNEYFESPQEFQQTKKGDCDGYSLHSYAILKALNYEVKMYIIYFEDVGHAVTVFKNKFGLYDIFSNGVILKTFESSPVKAIEAQYPSWKMICKFKPAKYGKINWWNLLMSTSTIKWRVTILDKG